MSSRLSNINARETWLRTLQDRIEQLRFGVVQIVVHDSRVVQIEWTEKVRFDRAGLEAPRVDRHRGEASPVPAQLEA